MKILLRFDATEQIGSGHLFRCLSISNEIRKCNSNVELYSLGQLNDSAIRNLKEENIHIFNYDKYESEEKNIINCLSDKLCPDVILIDKIYFYTQEFILSVKKKTKVVLLHNICPGATMADAFILPSEHHPSDVINELSKNLGNRFFYGANYIVLNSRIISLKKDLKNIHNQLVISTGGADPNNVMGKIFELLNHKKSASLLERIKVIGLIGHSFNKSKIDDLLLLCNENIELKHFNEKYLLTANAIICTFGITTYELIYLNKVVLSVGHQKSNAIGSNILAKKGLIYDLGEFVDIDIDNFLSGLSNVFYNEVFRAKLLSNGNGFIDGNGSLRIAMVIMNLIN